HVMGKGESYYAWNDEKRIHIVTRGDPVSSESGDPIRVEDNEDVLDELTKMAMRR
ncbi:hypothetical protein H4S07_006874, partial [Coemansia furcata]